MHRRSFLAAAGALAGLAGTPLWAQAPQAALVIGNGDYKVGALANPVNDARAIGETLRGLGFATTVRENTAMRTLVEALREFSTQAPRHAVRLFFYAGHGLQYRGRNYLVPVDTLIEAEDEIPAKAADVGELVERLSALKTGVNILILDACRANPFAGGVYTDPQGRRLRFRGVPTSGLARLDAPAGTLIAYATAPGGVAFDGPGGKQSLYTRHLLTHLATPGLPIEQVFKRVRIGVAEDSARQQIPWESSSLMSEVCVRPGAGGRCG